jgi:hypothetical protein
MSSLKPKEIDFNEQWPIVLGTVRSVISMGRFGHTDKATWQERFFSMDKSTHSFFAIFIND